MKNYLLTKVCLGVFGSLFISLTWSTSVTWGEDSSPDIEGIYFQQPPANEEGDGGGLSGGRVPRPGCLTESEGSLICENVSVLPVLPFIRLDASNIQDPFIATEGYRTTHWTISDYPVFWFYIPYRGSSELTATFSLADESAQNSMQVVIPLLETPGIIAVKPELESPLEVGRYYWSFSVQRDPSQPSLDDFNEGYVEKVDLLPEIQAQLAGAGQLERVAILAENGIWYDSVTELASIRVEYLSHWEQFLKSNGLEALVDANIIDVP